MSARWDEAYWGSEAAELATGEALWGDETYEAASDNRVTTPVILVDWDEDGLYDGENEWWERANDFDCERGRQFVIRSRGDGFEPVMVGNFRVSLKNTDGRYDPFNGSSELAGLLSRNQTVYMFVQDEATGERYDIFTGYIDDIKANYSNELDSVTLRASDGKKKLEKAIVRSSSVQTSKQYDEALTDVLTAAAWGGGSNIDTTLSDTLPYWWMSGLSAWTELQDLSDATLGIIFIAADGRVTYKARVANDVGQIELTEDDIFYGYGIQILDPREIVYNRVRVYSRARNLLTDQTVWQATDKPQILAGESSPPIWANFSYNNREVPATAVTTPVENTDYEANTAIDGTGTDVSADVSLAITKFVTSAKQIYTNGGAGNLYMTLMKIRADIIVTDEYTYSEEFDQDSIDEHQEHELVIQTNWMQDINSAVEHAQILIDRLADPHKYPRVLLRAKPAKQFRELFELVNLNFATKNIISNQRIGYIRHSGGSDGIFDTIIYFEPDLFVAASGTWVFTTTFPALFA